MARSPVAPATAYHVFDSPVKHSPPPLLPQRLFSLEMIAAMKLVRVRVLWLVLVMMTSMLMR